MIGKTISHYKILAKLGSGGMGEVYKAEDLKLQRIVALKFLPPELTRDAAARQRFLHEAQASSALDHPNIGTVHEIDEFEGKVFIVMAYYEGQTLREEIQQGPMAVERAIELAIQIATGLSKAHGKDIVHRDLKPANMIITEDGIIKVIDFGLAKLIGRSLLTKTGTTVGTAAYMSPEQARNEDVDHRTDIWALGVILYEMLSGKNPFDGDYEQAVVYSIINESPEFISKVRSEVPIQVEQVIEKAITKDPVKRYQSMTELLNDLQTALNDIKSGQSINASFLKLGRRQRRRAFQIAGAVLVIFAAGFYFWRTQIAEAAPIPIAVVDFENATDEKQLDGLSGLLITSLDQSRRLTVLTRNRMFDILKQLGKEDVEYIDEALGREICAKANINTLVKASIRKLGGRYAIDLQVIDTDKDEFLLTAREEEESEANIFSMIDRLAEKTRRGLDEEEVDIQAAAVQVAEVTTPNLDAYYHYFKGEELVSKYRFEEAREEFNKAIAIDSTFGLAYYRLAYAYTWQVTDEHLAEGPLDKALEYIDRIPEKERYLLRAEKERFQNGYETAIPVLKEMELRFPNDKEMLFIQGDYMFHMGELENAAAYLERVLAMDSTHVLTLEHLALTYQSLSRYGDAERVIYAGLKKYPNHEALLNRLIIGLNAQNKNSEAEAFLRNGLEASPDSWRLWYWLGNILGEQNRFDEARQIFSEAFAKNPKNPDLLASWGRVLNNERQYDEAEQIFRQTLELDETHADALNSLGWLKIYTRKFREAEEIFKKAIGLYPKNLTIVSGMQQSLVSVGKSAEAEVLVRKTLKANPNSALFVVALATILNSQGKYDEAQEAYENLLVINPKSAFSHDRFGWFLFNRRNYAKADSVFRAGIVLDQNFANLYNGLGWTLIRRGRFQEAETVLRHGYELNPDLGGTINGLQLALRNLRKYGEAEEILRKALQSNPNSSTFLSALGAVLGNQKKYAEAEQVYEKAIEISPRQVSTISSLGWFYYNQGKYVEAEEVFEKGVKLNQQHLGILNGLASVKIAQKKYDEAIAFYEKLIAVRRDGNSLFLLGSAHLAKKDLAKAGQYFNEALAIDSTNARTYRSLAYLNLEQEQFDKALRYASRAVELDTSYSTNSLMAWALISVYREIDKGIDFAQVALDLKPDNLSRNLEIYPFLHSPEHSLGLAYWKKGDLHKAVEFYEKAIVIAPGRQTLKDELAQIRSELD